MCPQRQGGSDFALIAIFVVGRLDALARVIDRQFGNVRRNADRAETGAHRSSQIMQPPGFDLVTRCFDASIEPSLADTPTREWFCWVPAKHERAVTFAAVENSARCRYERNAMLPVVLGSPWRQYNSIAYDLAPGKPANFVAAATGQDQ